MILEEAILNEEKIVKEQEKVADIFKSFPDYEDPKNSITYGHHIQKAYKCAEEHRQLAGWLKELKQLREQTRWIPCDDRLPEEDTDVWIQYGPSMMVGYYKKDHTVYSPGYKDLDDTGWYDKHDEFICGAYDVMAWMPLPERYKPDKAESEKV